MCRVFRGQFVSFYQIFIDFDLEIPFFFFYSLLKYLLLSNACKAHKEADKKMFIVTIFFL